MTKRTLIILIAASAATFILLLLILKPALVNRQKEAEVKPQGDSIERKIRYGLDVTDYMVTDSIIPQGSYFGAIMAASGVPHQDVHQMVQIADTTFDLRKLRAGNGCAFIRSAEQGHPLRWFIYQIDLINFVVFDFGTPKGITRGAKNVDTLRHTYSGIINSSLWNAMIDDGKNPGLILDLSDIFAWTIDFYGIQKGDKFKVIYDELIVEEKSIGIGTIHAAWFEHMEKEHYAFRYAQDSMMQYFDHEGVSLRREFLKAPLEFRRISSHFSHSRLHPILRRYRPHHGVDYAAPSGTPVRSIGSGTVLEARRAGGAGLMVKIRHNSVYTTVSMHLKGFAPGIRAGARVQQGQVIGYVGSTGLSTGPHLDFRVFKNGTPINPLKLESPPAKPVHPQGLEQYKKDIQGLQAELRKITTREL